MNTIFKSTLLSAAIFLLLGSAFAQVDQIKEYKGNRLNRAQNTMSGNLVRTTYYNYGLVGNIGEISGEWPIGTGNEYVGDVSPLVGIEFVHPNGDTLHSVTTSDGPRGNSDGPGGGVFWGFEPLSGFAAIPPVGEDPMVAMSNQPSTWPIDWPDKLVTDSLAHDRTWVRDNTDPGWTGHWNGYFGKDVTNADQETYFQMDDNSDGEWFQRTDSLGNRYYFYPNADDTSRRGMGLRVSVRALQWSHFMAQDCIFWLYEITNISTHVYDKAAFGMVVGTLSGGRCNLEPQDDLAYFDLENDITYSWDFNDQGCPGWTPVSRNHNVGYVGYAFLESPGNPVDGIDNDGDSEDPNSPHLTPDVLGSFLAPRSFGPDQTVVLTDYNTYERTTATFPQQGPLIYFIRDRQVTLNPGEEVVEISGNGLDDNLNGLIDERSDHENLAYVDYVTGRGLNDLLMDEGRDDGIDNDGDWDPLTDDLGGDGVPLTGDVGEGDGTPTNGEPHFDKTDVDESDQIGLTSFDYFSPPGAVRMNADETLWEKMAPGRFEVVPGDPADGDFIYGSGYFPLRPGQTERFSMALLYGEDLLDITDNKQTVQQIYDENYNFARPPDKPTVWAVPGDGKVTLYWDGRASEASQDPICKCHDFEGYKIYRSTDPGFNEVFTVTDGLGRKVFHQPIAQFDLDNSFAYIDSNYFAHIDSAICDSFFVPDTLNPDSGEFQYVWCYRDSLMEDSAAISVEGFFPIIRNSVIYYLGNNSGLQHSWVDTTAENGQTYYYAVVAYDRGDIAREILPAENSKTIVVDPGGNITLDINTVVVTPRAPAAGYQEPQFSVVTHTAGAATGTIALEVVDPRLVADNATYSFTFDSESDSTQVKYSVIRNDASGVTPLIENEPLKTQDNLINQAERFATHYDSLYNLPLGTYDPALYYRVAGTQQFDGQIGHILVPRQIDVIKEASGWVDTTRGLYDFIFGLTHYSTFFLEGTSIPGDFLVEWGDGVVDTSDYFNWFNLLELPATPVNFRIKNLLTNEYLHFAFDEVATTMNGVVDNGEVIIFFQDSVVTWALDFRSRAATGDTLPPSNGDQLVLRMYQPYTSNDTFEYTTQAARVDADAVDLDRIKVYPNPYVAANPQEPSNPYNQGRGERRVTFNHLPDRCTIRIYTVRGDLVDVLEHDAGIDDGTENWDLRSRDGLNVAYGIYLFHVDSPYGEKTGRFAVIK